MTAQRAVHSIAKSGFKNGSLYDKARPSYPVEAVAYLTPSPLTRSSPVLEIGSGTGKFTTLIASHFDHLTALEPSSGFRELFAEKFPIIPCIEGTAEEIPLPDSSQEAIYIAQAFHWCSNRTALKEMSRVLAPHGILCMIWNLEDNRTPWVHALRTIYERFDGDVPQYRTGEWENVFHTSQPWFDYPLKHIQFEHKIPVDSIDQIWQRVLSKSYIQSATPEVVESVKNEVYAILNTTEFEYDSDGRILYPYVTDLYLTHKAIA